MDIHHDEKIPRPLADIYLRHGFQPYLIDVLASVPAGTADNMLQGIPVKRKDAELVLAVISARTGQNYNLSNVSVPLEGETHAESILPTDPT